MSCDGNQDVVPGAVCHQLHRAHVDQARLVVHGALVYAIIFAGDRIRTEVWDKAVGAYCSG